MLGLGGFTLGGEDFNAGSLKTQLVEGFFLEACHDVVVVIRVTGEVRIVDV